jgi:hypothetical protein
MSSEEQEILARIGQLAGVSSLLPFFFSFAVSDSNKKGQINRHRNQQSTTHSATQHSSRPQRLSTRVPCICFECSPIVDHSSRHAPYRSRGSRYGRTPITHHHRTLHLNSSVASSDAKSAGSEAVSSAGWVSRTDRHRQLINANVFERETRNRAQAIEHTRTAKLREKRQQEKARLKEFLGHQAHASSATANSKVPTGRNEITLDGIRFTVMDGGKKLSRVNGMSTQ